MKLPILIICFLQFVFLSNLFPQSYQIRYGHNYEVQGVSGIQNDNSKLRIVFKRGRCIVNDEPLQIAVGFLETSSDGNPDQIHFIYPNQCDTSLNCFDFLRINDKIICVGSVHWNQNTKSIFFKVDTNFNNIESREYSFAGLNYIKNITYSSRDNCFYTVTFIDSNFTTSMFFKSIISKWDTSMNLIWSKMLDYTYGVDLTNISIDDDGSLLASGNILDINAKSSFAIIKLDTAANIIAAKRYYLNVGNAFVSKGYYNAGNYYLCGIKNDTSAQLSSIYLLNLDSNLAIRWCRHYNNDGPGQPYLMPLNNNKFLISNGHSNSNSIDIMQMLTDPSGSLIWSKYYSNADPIPGIYSTPVGNNIVSLAISPFPSTTSAPYRGELILIGSDSTGYSGCYENDFSMPVSSYNNLVVQNIAVTTLNYAPIVSNINLVIDTISLDQNIYCYTGIEKSVSHKLILYPNPCGNDLLIELSETIDQSKLKIFVTSQYGSVIGVERGITIENNHIKISNLNLPSGVYYLTVVNNNIRHSAKLIKLND